MKITTRTNGNVTILDLNGKITIGVGDAALREAVHTALDAGAKRLLLNMAGVTTIDSSGVGELVSAYTTSSNRGTKLKLLNLPAKIVDIMTITQLITVFEVFDERGQSGRIVRVTPRVPLQPAIGSR